MPLLWWRPTREWEGQTVFIICGGPSVTKEDVEKLHYRRVIVANSSYMVAPWADFLVWADSRWWYHHEKKLKAEFKGRIVGATNTVRAQNLLRMQRKQNTGLASDGGFLTIKLTVTSTAINLAVHLGAKTIVLLGADGKSAADGRTHHHEKHPWKQLPGCWDKQRKELSVVANDLKKLGITCVNASPDSAWYDIFPKVTLDEYLTEQCAA